MARFSILGLLILLAACAGPRPHDPGYQACLQQHPDPGAPASDAVSPGVNSLGAVVLFAVPAAIIDENSDATQKWKADMLACEHQYQATGQTAEAR